MARMAVLFPVAVVLLLMSLVAPPCGGDINEATGVMSGYYVRNVTNAAMCEHVFVKVEKGTKGLVGGGQATLSPLGAGPLGAGLLGAGPLGAGPFPVGRRLSQARYSADSPAASQ